MNKTCSILIGWFIMVVSSFNTVIAQNMNTIYDTIYSGALKEKRAIKVLLPEIQKSDTNERYDVIYVTDGEWVEKLVAQISQYLAGAWLIPKTIMVSIPHNNLQGINMRERDFLPPHDSLTGQADNFLSFLKDELIPFVNKSYPTSGRNAIYGGSLGGTFVMYTLLKEPQLFDSYIAGDPAFWWNNYYINKYAADKMHDFPGIKTLFMTGRGKREGLDYRSMGIYSMDSIITAKSPKGLRWKSVPYLDETHRSIGLKTIYDGLRFTYYGYGSKLGFYPGNGVLLKNKPVTITPEDETYWLNLRYTTDGTEPTETSPVFEQMDISDSMTLKVKLLSTSGKYDQNVTGKFKIGKVVSAIEKPKNIKPGGLHYTYYKGEWESLPNFKKLKPDESGFTQETFGQYGIFQFPNQTKLACLIDGYLEIKEDGYYSFLIDADATAAAKLYLNDFEIIVYDGIDKSLAFQTFVLPLEKGFYSLRLEYLQKKGGWGLRFNYKLPGAWQTLPVKLDLLYSSTSTK